MCRTGLACMLIGLVAAACADPEELSGTYDESVPLDDGRDYAVRLSLYRFGMQVGGVVRFFQIEGPLEFRYNTLDQPFLQESFCAYFGPASVAGDDFVFSIPQGPGEESFDFHITRLDDVDAIQAEMARSQGSPETVLLDMNRVTSGVDRTCQNVTDFDVLVEFPQYDVGQAPDFGLAFVFAGYEVFEEGGERIVQRLGSTLVPVAEVDEGTWGTEARLELPSVPPEAGMSAVGDPEPGTVRYAVAYVVAFNDGNRDGEFFDTVPADRVLAVSKDYAIIYVAGAAEDLAPSVAGVFDNLADVVTGYQVYRITTVEDGNDANITEAVPRAGGRIILDPVEELPTAFPVLLPTEPVPTQ